MGIVTRIPSTRVFFCVVGALIVASAVAPGADAQWLDPSHNITDWHVACKAGDATCHDLADYNARWMWTKIRQCWNPPTRRAYKTVITSAIRLRDDGLSARPPDRTKNIVSLVIGLKPNGALAGRPEPNAAEPTAATSSQIDDLIRAIERCQPYNSLPSSQYQRWQQVFLRVAIEYKPASEPDRVK
jgi:hypothetical protein